MATSKHFAIGACLALASYVAYHKLDMISAIFNPIAGGPKLDKSWQELTGIAFTDNGYNVLRQHLIREFDDLVEKVNESQFDGLRGLQAVTAIGKDEQVIELPLDQATLTFLHTSDLRHLHAAAEELEGLDFADSLLDVVALLYEALVKGNSSQHVHYIAALPQQYTLPVLCRSEPVQHLMATQLELSRLVGQRMQGLQHAFPRAIRALQHLPGGRQALARYPRAQLRAAFHWAYAAAKTRAIMVPAEERLLLPWAQEVGALVPLLDLANHAPAGRANARLTVSIGRSRAVGVPDLITIGLVAARDILPGEQVTFSYVQGEEQQPGHDFSLCNARWLLEYGFTIPDGAPDRDCHQVNMTAAAVQELAQLLPSQLDLHAAASIAGGCQEFDSCWHLLSLDGHGMINHFSFQWLAGLLGGNEDLAVHVLGSLLQQQLRSVRELAQAAAEQLRLEAAAGSSSGPGGSCGAGAADVAAGVDRSTNSEAQQPAVKVVADGVEGDLGMGIGGCNGLLREMLVVTEGGARALRATLSNMGLD